MNTINIDKLINDFAVFERNNNRLGKCYHFNLLEEQQGHIVENSHSNILMRLLQYHNDKGWVFLERFLSRLTFNDIFLNDQTICIEREHNNIDILIWAKDNFAIIIENKVNGAQCRKNQIADYIEKTLNDSTVFENIKCKKFERLDKIWVVFLDRDGNNKPDSASLIVLDSKEFKNRYKHANYREHILPFLEKDVLPVIQYSDKELLAGVIQYIEYLKGDNFFGQNNKDISLNNNRVEWLRTQMNLDKNNVKRNRQLQNIYLSILRKKKESHISVKERTSLLNALITLSDEPLQVFLNTTQAYFKECNIIHHFTFYYCYMTPKQYSEKNLRVSFGWETMGMKALAKETEYIFGIVISGPKEYREDFENSFSDRLKELNYFRNNGITRLLNYRVIIKTKKPILNFEDDELKNTLLEIYEKYAPKDLMVEIQNRYYNDNKRMFSK